MRGKSLLFIPLILGLISGCNNTEPITKPPIDDDKEDVEIINGVFYEGEEVDLVIKEALGEYETYLPRLDTYNDISCSYDIDVETDIKYTEILYLVDDYEESLKNYSLNLKFNDFIIQNGATYPNAQQKFATKSVSEDTSLFIEVVGFIDQEDLLDKLLVRSYLYIDKELSWPEEEVVAALGKNIPSIECQYYNYQFVEIDENNTGIIILCYGDESLVDEYEKILKNNGYHFRYTSTESLNSTINHETKITIDFYYDEDYQALAILAKNAYDDEAWPTEKVEELLGFSLPIYADPAVSYQVNELPGDETSQFIKLEIDCVYAPKSSLDAYCALLDNDGWVQEDIIMSEDMCFMGFVYTKNNKTIDVVYFQDLTGQYQMMPALIIYIY